MHLRPTLLLLSTLALGTAACSSAAEETAASPADAPWTPRRDQSDGPEAGDSESPSNAESDATGSPSAGQGGLCDALLDFTMVEAAVSECEEALAHDCERIVGTLSDPYITEVERCVRTGGDAFACMADSVASFEKTAAHVSLATTFCDDCALDAPGCGDLFYVADSDWGLGALLLPFSTEVLDTVRTECTSSFFCVADFPSCAMDVVKLRINVDTTRECLMKEVL